VTPAPEDRPRLAPGCRISESDQQTGTLLVPEGAIKLRGTALRILEQCDGARTLAEILQSLQLEFSASDPERIAHDTIQLLGQLRDRNVVTW